MSAPAPPFLSAAPPAIEGDDAPVHVLVVDDEEGLRKSLARVLAARGMRVGAAQDGPEALEYIARAAPDVALVDMMMPNMLGHEVLSRAKESGSPVEVIMMTAFADVGSAVAAMKGGAYHFLTKPFHSNDAVVHAVLKAAEHKRLVDRTRKLEQTLLSRERFGEIIGTSPRMQEVYRLIEGVATATSTVLVLGESGTGKELVARAIHQRSPRAKQAFVAINCAAIPRELVESELFGHVRGAFTGAQAARAGLFETADRGTLFLDEVGDLPLSAQVKLLRTLQEGEVKRVGSDETKTVDVRVVAATNVDLMTKIEAGTFRKDLYYRLNVIAISLPSLAERREDVPLLVHHFAQKLALRMQRPPKTLTEGALAVMRGYDWPGNVRELEHAIERAVVLSQGDSITEKDLSFLAPHTPAAAGAATVEPRAAATHGGPLRVAMPDDVASMPYADAKRHVLSIFDDAYTAALLERAEGNFSEAARLAGLDRSNFRRILKRKR